jgi:hypothetical protein
VDTQLSKKGLQLLDAHLSHEGDQLCEEGQRLDAALGWGGGVGQESKHCLPVFTVLADAIDKGDISEVQQRLDRGLSAVFQTSRVDNITQVLQSETLSNQADNHHIIEWNDFA